MTPTARETIRRALTEDLGSGDITSECFIPADHRSSARLTAGEFAILAGTAATTEVFRQVDPTIEITAHQNDGDRLAPGTLILTATGPTRALLSAERTALNFLQRLSGIATLTRRFVDAVAGTKAVILDTRKTTPGLREFERLAVRAGGGTNHRFGLFDIDIILLDNMSTDQLRAAVQIRADREILLEASGRVNLDTVAAIAATGVDQISVGALTHSARAIDLSLGIS
jgi:nicotinate-nucleotide pyrophosphorylase (carboxylating)